jgi:nudix-type nucleoside diphosphatase (YffH/AdpP family)
MLDRTHCAKAGVSRAARYWNNHAPQHAGVGDRYGSTRARVSRPPHDPIILGRRTLYKGYLKVEALRLRLSDGAEVTREVATHGDAVAVLPYDPERRTALTVQLMRAPVLHVSGHPSLEEACAGMIEDGQTAEATAKREALEELGVELAALESVATVWSSPGVSTERVSLFLSTYQRSDRRRDGGGAQGEHEGISVRETALATLAKDADAGRVTDAKLLTLLLALRLRRPVLFE